MLVAPDGCLNFKKFPLYRVRGRGGHTHDKCFLPTWPRGYVATWPLGHLATRCQVPGVKCHGVKCHVSSAGGQVPGFTVSGFKCQGSGAMGQAPGVKFQGSSSWGEAPGVKCQGSVPGSIARDQLPGVWGQRIHPSINDPSIYDPSIDRSIHP